MNKYKPKLNITKWNNELEKPIFESWKINKPYKFNKNTKKKIFSIDTPPPYINTPIHIGQATTYVLMDMFARFNRMVGHEVLFPLGLDKNGLPIEIAAEKKYKIKLTETPREKFLEYCKKLLDEAGSETIDSFIRLGISFNSFDSGDNIGDVYETDSEKYRSLTQSTFIDLWKKNLIYEDERINNWDPELQTTLADSEIEYKDLSTTFNDIKFKVKGSKEEITVGTTRPELICTCGAIIFNPKDKRYKKLKGKTAITPLFEKEVPILAHPYAEIDKGTGLAMMCSAGDLNDIRFFRDMKLDPIIAIEKDGTMNHHAGFLRGLKVKDARKKIIDELKNKKLLVKQTHVNHRTPVSERSGTEIEFISMKELYLKQLNYKDKMKELANKLNFYSDDSRKILLNWIDSISIDWPLTRRRYYATEVPLWYSEDKTLIALPKKGSYHQPWKENPPKDAEVYDLDRRLKGKVKDFKNKWIGEQRVFDTWFDSSISALYILMYERNPKFFKKAFPCTLRPSGKEIVRNWGYYSILRCYQLTNKLIFRDYWVNYHIVDEKGHKMSKSRGNIIDPQDILDKYGAEPFRLWSATEGNLEKTDFRCSSERIGGAGKTIIKLVNVSRFISMFPKVKRPRKLEELDKFIINELNDLVKLSNERFKVYDFHNPTTKIKSFIWDSFASHYLELVKPRAYNQENKFTKEQQESAFYTLHYCLNTLLKLLSPVIPFVTYKIYQELYGKDIHFESFPKKDKEVKISFKKEDLIKLNSKIWKEKKDKGLSLRSEMEKLTIPNKFKSIKEDLIRAHNIKNLKINKK